MPRRCSTVAIPGGAYAIVTRDVRSRKCAFCQQRTMNSKLCDFPVREGKTCDAVMCPRCATHRDPDLDYCPLHAAKAAPAQPQNPEAPGTAVRDTQEDL